MADFASVGTVTLLEKDTRISLDSVVSAFCDGLSTVIIVQLYPLLTLEQVYGAIAFYLANLFDIKLMLI